MVNYSGRWDILQAVKQVVMSKDATPENCEQLFQSYLCFSHLPEPDLLIRTAGVQRLSNFMLWDLAYTELYFTKTYWPDFNEQHFSEALNFYAERERRFGLTSEQVEQFVEDDLPCVILE